MRTARKRSESNIYHLVIRGAGRQLIFEDDNDRLAFLDLLEQSLADEECRLHAWCLMGNHVHLLAEGALDGISRLMHSVCGRYAQRFNMRHERTGHLFQGRYMSEPVDDDVYFLTVLRYIHQNPEKAGIASCCSYRWSSYGEYASAPACLNRASLCDTEPALRMLGGCDEFKLFHAQSDDREFLEGETLRSATRSMPDAEAAEIARSVVGSADIASLKSMNKAARNEALKKMKAAGLTVRQIERLTGIGRGVVSRA